MKQILRASAASLVLFSVLLQTSAWADPSYNVQAIQGEAEQWNLPPCLDQSHSQEALAPMNEEVLRWKVETPNQTLKRARIRGVLVRIIQMRKSHAHFDVKIGPGDQDHLELIYNREFGEIPRNVEPGKVVDSCGDYITSREQAGRYPPSPMGAILHWIHFNPGDRDGGRHESGYIAIDGHVYGQLRPKLHTIQ